MNFFKQEQTLSQRLRAADPLASTAASTPQLRRPRDYYGLALPLLATAALPFFWVSRPQPRPLVAPASVSALQRPSPAEPVRVASRPKRVPKEHIASAKEPKAPAKERKRAPKQIFPRAKISLAQTKSVLAKAPSSLAPEKTSVAVAKNDPGEALVISVRPITPDELRQELQNP